MGVSKRFCKRTIEHLYGVRKVINNIKLNQKITPTNVADKIEKAYERSAHIDAKNIKVTIDGHKAILRGKVNSIKEKDDKQITTYNADGITNVKNKLTVEYDSIYIKVTTH